MRTMLYPPWVSDGQEQQSVVTVRETLKRLGARGEVRRLDDSARTAKEAADALGIEVGQIASSLIFLADGAPILVIASGGHRVDTTMLSAILEGAEITKANADDVRQATGFAIGGVAPIGHLSPSPTWIDPKLLTFERVWAAAGTPRHIFPIAPHDLARLAAATVADFTV